MHIFKFTTCFAACALLAAVSVSAQAQGVPTKVEQGKTVTTKTPTQPTQPNVAAKPKKKVKIKNDTLRPQTPVGF